MIAQRLIPVVRDDKAVTDLGTKRAGTSTASTMPGCKIVVSPITSCGASNRSDAHTERIFVPCRLNDFCLSRMDAIGRDTGAHYVKGCLL